MTKSFFEFPKFFLRDFALTPLPSFLTLRNFNPNDVQLKPEGALF